MEYHSRLQDYHPPWTLRDGFRFGGAGTGDRGPWDGRSHGPRRKSFSRSAGQLGRKGKSFVQGSPVERLGDRWPVGEHDVCCRSIKKNDFAR
jgi:hypothetical protein